MDWREWLAEGAGSAIVLFAVVTAKDLSICAGPPLSDLRWSIAIIAVVAGLAVGTVALSGLSHRIHSENRLADHSEAVASSNADGHIKSIGIRNFDNYHEFFEAFDPLPWHK